MDEMQLNALQQRLVAATSNAVACLAFYVGMAKGDVRRAQSSPDGVPPRAIAVEDAIKATGVEITDENLARMSATYFVANYYGNPLVLYKAKTTDGTIIVYMTLDDLAFYQPEVMVNELSGLLSTVTEVTKLL